MSKVKQKEFVVDGVTTPLIDGQTRQIKLVAVLTEEPKSELLEDTKTREEGGKVIVTTTYGEEQYTQFILRVGMSVLNPIDEEVPNPQLAYNIAKGKALKPGKAILTLVTRDRFFGKDEVETTLKLQLARVLGNPNRFIKVSEKLDIDAQLDLVEKINNIKQ